MKNDIVEVSYCEADINKMAKKKKMSVESIKGFLIDMQHDKWGPEVEVKINFVKRCARKKQTA